ncbi:hypothetical protein [Lentiprolixibacter aurantiacus]|uniref:Lipocalin-like domain-containing protein n=1 Tax=Lentiprolixibacter aurantiacus TaxID=2993939 RepID=A0AAE3MNH3_9FLAO|nr:hypothetical protein [Lentiprolixibacter aurantiacus]MCX2720643.1 hypothetical protein [Lentiprolixibacter aurantiacus]
MKKIFNYSALVLLLITALTFTSCQEEFEELPQPDEQQTLMASSSTAKLIQRTAAKDGSFDNIVDGASCFAVNFPYTVNVNGLDITIDSPEDLKVIEEIFDQLDDDIDVLEILFPITITLEDYTEITISNFEELRALAAECIEGGGDDDIECIDFVYPVTFYTFDINEVQTGSVTIENDEQLRRFLEGLDDDDLISIDFPVDLKLYDGTVVTVTNNAELAITIENAKEACDEDDDNDYNDDDFNKERLANYLVECPWIVLSVERDGVNQSAQYEAFLMRFREDGSVTVRDRAGNVLNGEWELNDTNSDYVELQLFFDTLVDFNLSWKVYEVGEGKIKLFSDEGNHIVMKIACEEDVEPDSLRQILRECSWVIKKVKNQGEEINRLLGYEFNFFAEGVVTLSNEEIMYEGTWEIVRNEQGRLVMSITIGDEPGVNFEWPLSSLRYDRLKFEIPEIGYELILQRVCDDNANDGDVVEIRSIMMEGEWVVAQYQDNGVDITQEFEGYDFNFQPEHLVTVSTNMDPLFNGLWRVIRNYENELKVYLNFGDDAPFAELTDDWNLVSITADRIELKDWSDDPEAGTVAYDVLVFERKQ